MSARPRFDGEPEKLPHQLVDVLLASLTALATAGHIDTACRLAGQACAVLRESSPAACQTFNVFLHRFAGRTLDP